jgi:hypothetical protein
VSECEHCGTELGNALDILAEWKADGYGLKVYDKGDDMICEVTAKISRSIPGEDKVRNFVEVFAKNTLSETEDPKSPVDMMKEVVDLCDRGVKYYQTKATKGE